MSNGEEEHGPEMPSEEGGTLLSDAVAEESPSMKRKSPEKNNDGATATTEEPEPKKTKVTSLGIPAVKEDGKKYYQCKMSGCVKVRLIFYDDCLPINYLCATVVQLFIEFTPFSILT